MRLLFQKLLFSPATPCTANDDKLDVVPGRRLPFLCTHIYEPYLHSYYLCMCMTLIIFNSRSHCEYVSSLRRTVEFRVSAVVSGYGFM